MNNKIDYEQELSKIKFDFHTNYNGIFINNREKQVLKTYGFDITKYKNIKQLIFDLEEYLLENTNEELEDVATSLAEFNYYHNTIK